MNDKRSLSDFKNELRGVSMVKIINKQRVCENHTSLILLNSVNDSSKQSDMFNFLSHTLYFFYLS